MIWLRFRFGSTNIVIVSSYDAIKDLFNKEETLGRQADGIWWDRCMKQNLGNHKSQSRIEMLKKNTAKIFKIMYINSYRLSSLYLYYLIKCILFWLQGLHFQTVSHGSTYENIVETHYAFMVSEIEVQWKKSYKMNSSILQFIWMKSENWRMENFISL